MSGAVFYTRLDTQDLYPSAQELAARLKTPISYRDDAIDALENELRKTLCAAMCAVRVPILRNADESLDFPTFSTKSEALKKAMEGCDEAFLLAVTLGMQTEQWLHLKMQLQKYLRHVLVLVHSRTVWNMRKIV